MVKKLKWNLVLMSLLYLGLGVFLVMKPGTALNIVCYALGGVVLACAAVQLVRYFAVERGVFQSQLTLVSGIVCLALGAFLIIRSDIVVSILPIVFGLFVIFDAIGRVQNALDLRRCGYDSWKGFLFLPVLSVVLGVVMWQVNKDDVVAEPTSQPAATETIVPEATEAPDDDTPVGYEVGMKCPDFTVPLYGEEGGEFTLSAQKGKVTVINFWATWCTPCVAELPYFAELYAEYGDEISLVAIHSNLVTDDVDKFLAKESLDMPFALDKTGAVIKSLGGSTQLPMTVIVDADGKIVYNKVGSVTLTVLEGLVAPLLAE